MLIQESNCDFVLLTLPGLFKDISIHVYFPVTSKTDRCICQDFSFSTYFMDIIEDILMYNYQKYYLGKN